MFSVFATKIPHEIHFYVEFGQHASRKVTRASADIQITIAPVTGNLNERLQSGNSKPAVSYYSSTRNAMPVIHSTARIDSDAAIAAGGEAALAREVVRFLIEELHIDGVSPDAHVHPVSGGITNGLLRVSRQQGQDAVLVRLFGKNTEYLIDRERDNALFEYLGETGIGPRLYAVFGNGRVEQMLHAKALAPEEMRLRQPVDVLAADTDAIAEFHALPAPGVSASPVLWKVRQRFDASGCCSASCRQFTRCRKFTRLLLHPTWRRRVHRMVCFPPLSLAAAARLLRSRQGGVPVRPLLAALRCALGCDCR